MFQLQVLTRENNNTTMGAPSKSLFSPQSESIRTVDLSFASDEESTQQVLTDYESDSNMSLTRQDSMGSSSSSAAAPRRGGLRRSIRKSSPLLKVGFADVTIRRHNICVGDNPAVSLGVPVSMDWKVLSEETTTVDEYDASDVHPTGQRELDLAIPCQEREEMVRRAGFTTEDIRTSVRQVNTTKMEREKTIDTLQNASKEEFMERMKRGVWNATISRKNKQKERALLRQLKEKDAKRVLIPPAC